MLWYPCDILGIRLLNLSWCRACGTWYGTCSVEEHVRIRSRWVILSELFHVNPFSFHETSAVFRQNHQNPSLPGKEFHSCCITCYQWEMDVVFLLCQQIPSIESIFVELNLLSSIPCLVWWNDDVDCWLENSAACFLVSLGHFIWVKLLIGPYVLQRSGAVLGP